MNEHSHIRIESPAFASESVHLLELSGREALSQLFELHAQVASSDPAGLDVDALIGAPAVLVFERGGAETRRMGGLIAGIRDSMHEETGKMVYDLWFAPRAFRLGLVETYEIFMDLSVPDIVKKKLERAGLLEGARRQADVDRRHRPAVRITHRHGQSADRFVELAIDPGPSLLTHPGDLLTQQRTIDQLERLRPQAEAILAQVATDAEAAFKQ